VDGGGTSRGGKRGGALQRQLISQSFVITKRKITRARNGFKKFKNRGTGFQDEGRGMLEFLPLLLKGAVVKVEVTLLASILAVVMGFLAGFAKL